MHKILLVTYFLNFFSKMTEASSRGNCYLLASSSGDTDNKISFIPYILRTLDILYAQIYQINNVYEGAKHFYF